MLGVRTTGRSASRGSFARDSIEAGVQRAFPLRRWKRCPLSLGGAWRHWDSASGFNRTAAHREQVPMANLPEEASTKMHQHSATPRACRIRCVCFAAAPSVRSVRVRPAALAGQILQVSMASDRVRSKHATRTSRTHDTASDEASRRMRRLRLFGGHRIHPSTRAVGRVTTLQER